MCVHLSCAGNAIPKKKVDRFTYNYVIIEGIAKNETRR